MQDPVFSNFAKFLTFPQPQSFVSHIYRVPFHLHQPNLSTFLFTPRTPRREAMANDFHLEVEFKTANKESKK